MSDAIFRDYDARELERQFNPRAYSPDWEKVSAQGIERSKAYRANAANARLDVSYGPGELETMDLFRPGATTGAPIHMYIHGGFWRSRYKTDFSYVAGPLVEAGAIVAMVDYALCPAVTLDEIVREMRAALAWLWHNARNFGGDPDRLHVAGHSAGGHLAAMMMATDWPTFAPGLPADLVKSGTLISGIYEIAPVIHTSIQNEVRLTAEIAERNSPMLLDPATRAPLAAVVGGSESEEFRRQTCALAHRWSSLGVPVDHFEMPGLDHFTILTETADANNRLTDVRLQLMGLA